MQEPRKIIKIDEELCTGCGECVPDCAEGSLEIIAGKARLVADKLCDGLGACLSSCPAGALSITERKADEFDEKAVAAYLAGKKKETGRISGGCPSTRMQIFTGQAPCQAANKPLAQTGSALSHWPIQIRLIPSAAPFLANCDLLVAADCTTAAYADFQQDFLQGRVIMMGCPKFDDVELYRERFTEILQKQKINSLTILIMEVPCCASMLDIIKSARDRSGSPVMVRQTVVSTLGRIIDDRSW